MLRLCLIGVLFAILFADGGSNSKRNVTENEGNYFAIFVDPEPNHIVKTCVLKSPQNKIFKFTPRDVSATDDKYEVHESMDCLVSVHNIDINDEGIWVLTYDHELQDSANTATVDLTVVVTEPVYKEDENIMLLSMIDHFTRIGLSIDISLDKPSFEEECYVRPPNGELTKAENFNMENVIVQRSSNFVSCRITLGPMSASLLGNWRLCGKSTQTDEMRCQPANIVWNRDSNPNAEWGSLTQSMFSHPVHFGGSVNPGVASTGNVVTCNVITPNGEDLVITRDVNYPHIERIAFDRENLCSINFTNIDRTSIGEWTIYGKFRSAAHGLHEIHQPLNFFLYNEEQPYDQAYNVTVLPEDRYLVILGRNLEVSVKSVVGQVENCQYRMPTGQSYDLKNAMASAGVVLKSVDAPGCRITLSSITKDMLGEWQLIGKFSNGNQFTERRQTFYIIEEDPASPIIDDRVVENLPETILVTKFGASHRVTITTASRIEHESCHIMTPNGLQYAFIDGFHIRNVEVLEENGVDCGVKIDVLDFFMLGDWILIARGTRSSTPIERRLHFSFLVEEETTSLGHAITITEGADLHLNLPYGTHDTCKLYANDEEVKDFEVDENKSCGYIVRNVTRAHHGLWAIVHGDKVIHRATVEVNILESVEISVEDMVWRVGSSVNISIGPEDAVYCRLIDSNDNYVYDGFGPCRAVVDRVTKAHQGLWTISVGVPGKVMLRQKKFYVDAVAIDSKPAVSTSVQNIYASVILRCNIVGEHEVDACSFRDPSGNVLIASHGVGQDGFSGRVQFLTMDSSESNKHICNLRLLKPSSEHQGIWRCAVKTARDTSYGFLTITESILDLGSSDIVPEPELKGAASEFGGEEGDAVTMSCSIDATVRYCYFRAPNGTVFNVGPSISSTDYEYVGNGFDAGECGIRFNSLLSNDSGNWSCNVGLVHKRVELSRAFEVSVYVSDPMSVYHGWYGDAVSLRLEIGGAPELEYCRFVRIDGLGFTNDDVPSGYYMEWPGMLMGVCSLKIFSPVPQDLEPWTVVAKTIASDGELSMRSTFELPPPLISGMPLMIPILMWTLFALMCLLLILAAVALIPTKNREWTYKRASAIRTSFKKQQPRPVHNDMLY